VTTDERIVAIAMHLEITVRMVEDNEKRASQENAKITSHIERILGIVETLAHTATDHERRIERLES
jgi:ribosome-binding protein aMBF1 (putative translation factor)